MVIILFISIFPASAETLHWARANHPEDIVFRFGETDQFITWQPESDVPNLNWIITLNNSKISEGTWSSGNIQVPLDTLAMESHEYKLEL